MNRSPNGINLHRFLEGYGVRVLPYTEARGWAERPVNVVYGGRTVARLMRKDMDRAGLVIRCIQASDARCFDDVVIWSVWSFLSAHMANSRPHDAVNTFRSIDLGAIKRRASALTTGDTGRMAKTAAAIATLLADAIIPKDEAA
ncbi:MAG: hypothetical protein ACK4P4_09175 [Allorhizobium sp.]